MKEALILKTDICLYKVPANIARLINALIDHDNYQKMHNARVSLLKMGKTIIPQLHKLVCSDNSLLRMEVAKLIQLKADKRSIKVLIALLDDREFDIRWVAAEGLIRIGRKSIVPMLKAVRDGRSSLIMNKSVHQVLASLLLEEEKMQLMPLMQSLENYHGLHVTAPVEALRALKSIAFN